MHPIFELLIAAFLDILLGNTAPVRRFHPARLIAMLTGKLDHALRKKLDFELKNAGFVLTVLVESVFAAAVLLLSLAGWWARIILIFFALSARRLSGEGMAVLKLLRRHELTLARARLDLLVRRDTDRMTEQDVVRTMVEYMARSFGPELIAPVFWMGIGCLFHAAPVFGWICLAAGSLNRTAGKDNDGFEDVGCFPSAFFSFLSYIPSQLCALLVIASSALLRMNVRRAAQTVHAERALRRQTPVCLSVAATAGALDIQLGGDIRVRGVVLHKRRVGTAAREPECEDVARTLWLGWCAYGLMLILSLLTLFAR